MGHSPNFGTRTKEMPSRRVVWCVIVLLAAGNIRASDTSARKVLLNGAWQRAIAADGPIPEAGWEQVRVPHRSREFESEPPESAWYRCNFRIPRSWAGGHARFLLCLERVRHYVRVYINGAEAGEHYGMRTPVEIDTTGLVRPGENVRLVIYTHNASGRYAHGRAKDLSEKACRALDTVFWHTSAPTVGIEGNVWLKRVPKVRVHDIYVRTSVRNRQITVQARVTNQGRSAVRKVLDLDIVRRGRIELDMPQKRIEVAGGTSQVFDMQSSWKNPVLWGRPPYGEPVLYFARAVLSGSGGPGNAWYQRFGFREIWTEDGRILLNGRPLLLWGDHSIPYVHERQWLTRKLPALARAGCSVVEHHRYSAPPVLYDVADELGMFVISSNYCVGTAAMPRGLSPAEKKLVIRNHVRATEQWIKRDRNHPSILIWNVTDNWGADYCVPLLRRAGQLDDTRITDATHRASPKEMVDLMDTYQLFGSLEQIGRQIERVRESADLPRKPIRVGEAGIFQEYKWDFDAEPRLKEGWAEFIDRMPEQQVCGLQTFSLTDMDYRGFEKRIPGMLFRPVQPDIRWPAQSGFDARIDPFGRGTQEAWGKAALYLNWCDPSQPVCRPTPTAVWWNARYEDLTGRKVGPLAATRVPEVIVAVHSCNEPVSEGYVVVEPLQGQALEPYGVMLDPDGRAWFVLPEPGRYRFRYAGRQGKSSAVATCEQSTIQQPPGYDHLQRIEMPLQAPRR
jgi:hypothetical protein